MINLDTRFIWVPDLYDDKIYTKMQNGEELTYDEEKWLLESTAKHYLWDYPNEPSVAELAGGNYQLFMRNWPNGREYYLEDIVWFLNEFQEALLEEFGLKLSLKDYGVNPETLDVKIQEMFYEISGEEAN